MLVVSFTIFAIVIGLTGLAVFVGLKNNQANWGNRFANILDGLIRVYCRKFHRQSNQTIDIPRDRMVLIASNHISGIDPFLLITATNRPIRFMIAKEEYQRPLLNWMFRAAGCIPVDRGGRVEKAFRSTLRSIQAGELVAVFPQGGIHHHSNPRELIKPGIMKLSQLSQCDILPVRISGVSVPGSVVAVAFKRSSVELNFHSRLTPQQVELPEFRNAISLWLLGNGEMISLSLQSESAKV